MKRLIPKRAILVLRVLLLLMTPALATAAPKIVKHISIEGETDRYMEGLLRLALSYSDENYKLAPHSEWLPRQRVMELINLGQMSVMWAGTNRDREHGFDPIRIPAYKGLLGYRVFIIRPDSQSKFDQVRTFQDLTKFKFGQGRTWSDGKILANAGLTIVSAKKTDNLLWMTYGERFDAFPRGVHEPWTEITRHDRISSELTVEKSIVIIYRLAYYFFVKKNDSVLHAAIKNGLETAIQDGSFDEYFYSSRQVSATLAAAQLGDRKAFYIDNHILPPDTPVDRSELWLSMSDLRKMTDGSSGDGNAETVQLQQ